MTDPFDPSTLPKRVVMNWRAPFDPPAYDRLSETLYIDFGQPFVQPMTLVGFTALSVEIITIFSTP